MQGRGFNSFASNMIKISVNETEWSSLLARTRVLILYISIWKFDFGPETLPGLSRNGPLATSISNEYIAVRYLQKQQMLKVLTLHCKHKMIFNGLRKITSNGVPSSACKAFLLLSSLFAALAFLFGFLLSFCIAALSLGVFFLQENGWFVFIIFIRCLWLPSIFPASEPFPA